jgi:hypothetical protein
MLFGAPASSSHAQRKGRIVHTSRLGVIASHPGFLGDDRFTVTAPAVYYAVGRLSAGLLPDLKPQYREEHTVVCVVVHAKAMFSKSMCFGRYIACGQGR